MPRLRPPALAAPAASTPAGHLPSHGPRLEPPRRPRALDDPPTRHVWTLWRAATRRRAGLHRGGPRDDRRARAARARRERAGPARAAWRFGHRRLKIIDLSERAEQPMVDAELGLTVVFNGCIYNYPRAARASCEARGYASSPSGDTEVLLKAYHAWGARLRRAAATACSPSPSCERDSGGVLLAPRPARHQAALPRRVRARLRFASTLPALLAAGEVDTADRPGRAAPLHDLPRGRAAAAHDPRGRAQAAARRRRCAIEADGTAQRARRTGSLAFDARDDAGPSFDGLARTRVLAALRRAVERRRWSADVPVGVLLSGGLDSSLIVGLLAEAGQRAPARPSPSASSGAAARRATSSATPTSIARALRDRAPPDPRRPPSALLDAPAARASTRCPSRWSATTTSASTCCRRRCRSTSRWCRAGRAPTRSSAATTGTRRCWTSDDPVARLRAGVLRPRPRRVLARACHPTLRRTTTQRGDSCAEHFARPGRGRSRSTRRCASTPP